MILDRLIDESDPHLMMSKQSWIDIWSQRKISRSTRWSFVPLSVTSPIAGPENNIYSYPGIYQYLPHNMNYLDPGEESEGHPRPQAVHWRAGDQAGQPEGESGFT